MSSLEIGSLVQVRGRPGVVGIVRFKGPTAFGSGEWIGVELSDTSGKNDGSVQGNRYFTCIDGAGIFTKKTALRLAKGADASVFDKREREQRAATRPADTQPAVAPEQERKAQPEAQAELQVEPQSEPQPEAPAEAHRGADLERQTLPVTEPVPSPESVSASAPASASATPTPTPTATSPPSSPSPPAAAPTPTLTPTPISTPTPADPVVVSPPSSPVSTPTNAVPRNMEAHGDSELMEELCIENAELRDALDAARAEIEELLELRDAGEEMEETLTAALDEAQGRVAALESELLDTADALAAARAATAGAQTKVVVRTVEVASPLKPVDLPAATPAAAASADAGVDAAPASPAAQTDGPSLQDWELTVAELEEQRRTVKEAEFKVSALEAKLVAAREVERRLHEQVSENRAELESTKDQLAKVTGAQATATDEDTAGPSGGLSYDELRRMVIMARAPRRLDPLGPHRVPLLPDLPAQRRPTTTPVLALSAQMLEYTRRW